MSSIDCKRTEKTLKYQKIVNYIKDKIAYGEWPIGSKIPSQRQLAKLFEVNRSTVITALEELIADGLIEGKIGMGTVVVNNTWTLLATNPSPDWNEHVKSGLLKPSQATVQEINQAETNTNLIQLSKGELSKDVFPLDTMKLIIRRVSEKIEAFGYEEPKGFLPLREALSNYLKTFGIHASTSSILIVSGALQALQLISVGLLHRGSTVLLEKPSYLYSLHVFQSAGMKLTGLPMGEHDLFPNSVTVSKKQRGRALLYSIPCFHNPTGILMSEKQRQKLLEVCEKEQLPIIEDDIYRELWIDAPPPPPLKALDKNGHVLYLGSLSKTLSPGLRIGWIVGPEPVIERLSDIKMQTDYGSSSLSQRVAAEWLTSGLYEQHLESVREQLKIRRTVVLEALNIHLKDIATWDVPKGGFFIWLKILPKLSMRELYIKALSEGILFNPGNIYGQESHRYLRLSYGYASLKDLKQGIYQISRIIRELAKR
ncbi:MULTISPECIES: PLP-dependent aminotransferase family protein [Bacillus]|uniref:aminotransferase-like domain-containing protein n=1 Tax=Bacillus TaxID=1386 RepID=UPI00030CDE7E|nr:PLP-dependent aminotransferase family protein [Bacillus pseudomycoides]MED1597275.1 PLP-dependent aminotransferase family protein [Bacillus pseudomycoides]MED4713672.1 PLP-dependent aminotransferase family protein [Bacillus pseudomycoides]OOR49439.1 GntR family transcriptional regulator [Bacillus pseudomycoides]PDY14821.1 PLP-dependent aminotransferase family protein [Bacillus pseudomycoides]PEI45013.1 PLP-dependent aminotransferase family protein [Bacillus pseudomycoides]